MQEVFFTALGGAKEVGKSSFLIDYGEKVLFDRGLKLLSNKKNHGKGYVVRQGLLAAKGDWRLFVDADNSTSIDQLEKFLPFIKTYDIIIGSRAIAGAVLSPPQPFFRSAAGAVVKLLIRFIVAISEIQDTQCGFKLFSKKAVESIFTKCTISGWVFDAEILKIAKNMGYATKEVPVVWQNDAASKVRLISIGGILRDLVKIRHNAIMVKYHE